MHYPKEDDGEHYTACLLIKGLRDIEPRILYPKEESGSHCLLILDLKPHSAGLKNGSTIDQIDQLTGDYIEEESTNEPQHRVCRLLIGMHQPPEEQTRWLYSNEDRTPDPEFVRSQKVKIARDFRHQLQLGLPTKKDELTLRRLSQQLKYGKVCVKLYLRHPLHAKLYLAYRPDDNFNKIMALMGSSNLTFSGLCGNGELNAEFADSDQSKKLADWFAERWDDRFCIDITNAL